MKLYQVEYRAVINVEADDLLTAELDASAFIKENPHVIRVRGAREINCAAPARQIPTDTFRALGRSIVPMSCATADLTSRWIEPRSETEAGGARQASWSGSVRVMEPSPY
jgi:hypothetical protein